MRTARLYVGALALVLAAGCEGAPRMRVDAEEVPAGASLRVRFDGPVGARARDRRWLTLVPRGSSDALVGDRVLLDEGAAEATVPTVAPGAFELRLHDGYPRRAHHVVQRVSVDVVERPDPGTSARTR